MKKYLAFLLALVLCLSLCACGGTAEDTTPTEPEAPQVEDDGIMKILLIGHSLGSDSSMMFPDVCRNEGMENLVFGRLYHSGCRMAQHVDYAKQNAAQYSYDEYDISKDQCWQRAQADGSFLEMVPGGATDIYIEDGSIAQTIQFALQRHDWDLIILQAGSSESANYRDHWYTSAGKQLGLAGYTQELIDYVNANDIEPATPFKFAWNMVWSSPKDPSVRRDSTNLMLLTEFEDSEYVYYKAMVKVLQEELEPNFDFEYVFPAGTTMQNLKSTKLTNAEIYRDYGHVTDFGRLAAAYTWYCTLTGTDIADCKIPPMNHKVLLDKLARNTGTDWELTGEKREMLIEAVGNAVKNPYDILPTQFAE